VDIEQFVNPGLIEANNDILADFDNGHAHLPAHFLHIPGSGRILGDIDVPELDIVRPEVLHGSLAPTTGGRRENNDFGLLFLFYGAGSFFELNSHSAITFHVC
jgi:hypothetical protein